MKTKLLNPARLSALSQTLIPAFASVLLLTPNASRADFQIQRWESQHEDSKVLTLRSDFTFLSTTSNFDPDGSAYDPAGLTSAKRIHWDSYLAYGASERLSIYGRLSWTRSSIDHPTVGESRFGLGDQAVGASYRIWEGEVSSPGMFSPNLSLQFQFDFPAYDNDTSTANNTPWLGNQTTDITGGAFFEMPIGDSSERSLSLVAGAGYTKRNRNFSAQLPYSVELRVRRATPGIIGRLGIFGVMALGDDPLDGVPLASLSSVGSGGSFLTGSSAASLTRVHGEFGYQTPSPLNFFATLGMGIFGKSAQKDTRFGAGIGFRFGGEEENSELDYTPVQSREPVRNRAAKKSNRGFVPYNDQFEGKILRTNDRLNLIKIDKGTNDGVQPGQLFDVFSVDKSGVAAEPIARVQVQSVRPSESALLILEYFKEMLIEEGFIVKRPLQ